MQHGFRLIGRFSLRRTDDRVALFLFLSLFCQDFLLIIMIAICSAYTASKWAVRGLSLVAAAEWGPLGDSHRHLVYAALNEHLTRYSLQLHTTWRNG
jgi:hypothetical protein